MMRKSETEELQTSSQNRGFVSAKLWEKTEYDINRDRKRGKERERRERESLTS